MKNKSVYTFLISLLIFGGLVFFINPVSAAEGDICLCVNDSTGVADSSNECPVSCAPGTTLRTCTCAVTSYPADDICGGVCPLPPAGAPSGAVPDPEETTSGGLLRAGLDSAADVSGLKPSEGASIQSVVGVIVREALKYLSILFIILILYAGIRWMTAGGDEGKVKVARNFLINASVGFIVTLISYQVVAFVIRSLEIVQ